MMTFICPGCGHRYTVDDCFWGTKVRCEGCQRRYFIGIRGAGVADVDLPIVPVVRSSYSSDAVGGQKVITSKAGAGIQDSGREVASAENTSCIGDQQQEVAPCRPRLGSDFHPAESSFPSSSPATSASSEASSQPSIASGDQGVDSCQDSVSTTIMSCSDWNRLIARNLDFALAYWIIVVSLGLVIAGTSWEERLASLPAWLDCMLSLPLYCLLEAGMYSWFHTTPGKWLMGVAIVDRNLRPLSSGDYFKRDLLVWLLGFGMGVPILSLFMVCYQSQRLKHGKETVYDEKLGTRAIMKGQTFLKTIAGVLLLLLIMLGTVALEHL